jgi:hypothetical protein
MGSVSNDGQAASRFKPATREALALRWAEGLEPVEMASEHAGSDHTRGMSAFKVVHATLSFITSNRKVIADVIRFLRGGEMND